MCGSAVWSLDLASPLPPNDGPNSPKVRPKQVAMLAVQSVREQVAWVKQRDVVCIQQQHLIKAAVQQRSHLAHPTTQRDPATTGK